MRRVSELTQKIEAVDVTVSMSVRGAPQELLLITLTTRLSCFNVKTNFSYQFDSDLKGH